MVKEAAVQVKHKNHKGVEVTRTFTPESVNPENPHHEGKTHVDLANEFVASNADKGAHIVKAAPKAVKPAKSVAPVDEEEETTDEETEEDTEEETDGENTEETTAPAKPVKSKSKAK